MNMKPIKNNGWRTSSDQIYKVKTDLVPHGCFSARTKLSVERNQFSDDGKSWAFTINRTSVPGFRAIGGGHAAALKVFSFLGLSPINKNSRAEQICIPPEKYSVFPPRSA